MENKPASGSNDQTNGSPEVEKLKPRSEDGSLPTDKSAVESHISSDSEAGKRLRHRTYRPSHKATFIGLGVVILILAVNAGVLSFVLKSKSKDNSLANSGQVTISPAALNKIGVNSSNLGNSGIELTIDPNSQFNGSVTIAGNVNIAGQLKLNSTFIASNANLTQLQAGNTSLSQLDVNGSTTLTTLAVRNGLAVTGATQFQGAVTLSQLLTVNNSVNVTGNVSIGGTFSTNVFSARSLTSTSTLTIAGHVITGGSNPSAGPGGTALGSNGTVSISGDDSAGTINVSTGTGAGSGTIVNVAFHTAYGDVPRVVITPVGAAGEFYLTNISSSGFSVSVATGLPSSTSFTIDYIVEQ